MTIVSSAIPVLTIDGPSGAGKGSISKLVAEELGWHYLDSGALYRALGIAAVNNKINLKNEVALVELVNAIRLEFKKNAQDKWSVFLDGQEVQDRLQLEETGNVASKIAVFPLVRSRLLDKQRAFQRLPGLVADGRDMGSVVFPCANHKVYLTASAMERGSRRYKQLIEKGINANLLEVIQDVEQRDERDKNRSASPLIVPEGAVYIDTSSSTIEEVVQLVLNSLENE